MNFEGDTIQLITPILAAALPYSVSTCSSCPSSSFELVHCILDKVPFRSCPQLLLLAVVVTGPRPEGRGGHEMEEVWEKASVRELGSKVHLVFTLITKIQLANIIKKKKVLWK